MAGSQPGSTDGVIAQFSLTGKAALVTGASRGLGRIIALVLAEAGADVVLVARNTERLEQVAEEVRQRGRQAVPIAADLSSMEQLYHAVDAAYTAYPRIDVLISNAGISPSWKLATEITEAEWDAIMTTNVKASFFLCTAIGKRMIQQGGGSIVTLASMAAVVGTPHIGAYGASKAAVLQFTRTLALEWASHHVRVNAIAPGFIDTDMTAGLLRHPYWGQVIRQDTPMGRPGQPQEIAALALYLSSSASSFATGQVFVVDGGITAG